MRVPAILASTLFLVAAASAQSRAQITAEQPLPSDQPRVYRTTESRIAIGRSITIASDEEVTDAVVVIGGSVRVDGRVRNNLVVVGGSADLGPQAEVRGDVVVVGGSLNRAPGARLLGSVNNIMIGRWAPLQIGDWYIPAVDVGEVGRWLSLFGAMFRVSLLAILMAMVLLVARAPVARIANAAAAAPARAFFAGLVAEIFFVPVLIVACITLIVTIIGIPLAVVLIPVAILTGAAAMVFGFTALATRVGEWLEDRLGWRGHNAFLAAALGLIVIVGPTLLATMLDVTPGVGVAGFFLLMIGAVVEFFVWTMGLGATLLTGFGRWSTVPPPVPPPSALPVVVNA